MATDTIDNETYLETLGDGGAAVYYAESGIGIYDGERRDPDISRHFAWRNRPEKISIDNQFIDAINKSDIDALNKLIEAHGADYELTVEREIKGKYEGTVKTKEDTFKVLNLEPIMQYAFDSKNIDVINYLNAEHQQPMETTIRSFNVKAAEFKGIEVESEDSRGSRSGSGSLGIFYKPEDIVIENARDLRDNKDLSAERGSDLYNYLLFNNIYGEDRWILQDKLVGAITSGSTSEVFSYINTYADSETIDEAILKASPDSRLENLSAALRYFENIGEKGQYGISEALRKNVLSNEHNKNSNKSPYVEAILDSIKETNLLQSLTTDLTLLKIANSYDADDKKRNDILAKMAFSPAGEQEKLDQAWKNGAPRGLVLEGADLVIKSDGSNRQPDKNYKAHVENRKFNAYNQIGQDELVLGPDRTFIYQPAPPEKLTQQQIDTVLTLEERGSYTVYADNDLQLPLHLEKKYPVEAVRPSDSMSEEEKLATEANLKAILEFFEKSKYVGIPHQLSNYVSGDIEPIDKEITKLINALPRDEAGEVIILNGNDTIYAKQDMLKERTEAADLAKKIAEEEALEAAETQKVNADAQATEDAANAINSGDFSELGEPALRKAFYELKKGDNKKAVMPEGLSGRAYELTKEPEADEKIAGLAKNIFEHDMGITISAAEKSAKSSQWSEEPLPTQQAREFGTKEALINRMEAYNSNRAETLAVQLESAWAAAETEPESLEFNGKDGLVELWENTLALAEQGRIVQVPPELLENRIFELAMEHAELEPILDDMLAQNERKNAGNSGLPRGDIEEIQQAINRAKSLGEGRQ